MIRIARIVKIWRWLRNHKIDIQVIVSFIAIASPFIVLWLNKTYSDAQFAIQRDMAAVQLLDSFFEGVEDLVLSQDEKKNIIVIARAQRVIRGLNSPKNTAAIIRFISDIGRSDLFDKSRVKSDTVRGFHNQFLDLQGIDLHGQRLSTVNLGNAYLANSDMRAVIMNSANLWQSILWGCNLSYAVLLDADLDDADLTGANLAATRFERASLRRARFTHADLQGTILDGADLQGAQLQDARNLTVIQLSKVHTLYGATLPDELISRMKAEYPKLFEKPPDADLLWKRRPGH